MSEPPADATLAGNVSARAAALLSSGRALAAEPRPEILAGGAFLGGLIVAQILKRLGS